MAEQITLKTKDICEALNIGRHQLRTWVDNLPPYANHPKAERSASRYTPADLLNFAVIKHLTEQYALSLPFLSKCSESLYSCIREPQSLTSGRFVFITAHGTSHFTIALDRVLQEGIVVDLRPPQALVYQYLGISPQQAQLQLGLVKVG